MYVAKQRPKQGEKTMLSIILTYESVWAQTWQQDTPILTILGTAVLHSRHPITNVHVIHMEILSISIVSIPMSAWLKL